MSKGIGGIAATVAAVAYTLTTVIMIWGTAVADPTRDDEGSNGALVYVTWIIVTLIGTIAAAVVLNAARNRSGVSGLLSKVAFGVVILAAVASFLAWFWVLWAGLLGIAFLMLAISLRSKGLGVTGKPSLWDWAIPVATPLGVLVAQGLRSAGVFESRPDDIDWIYTTGLTVTLVLIVVTLALAGRWLGSDERVTEEDPALAG